jgi:hypothetical protein
MGPLSKLPERGVSAPMQIMPDDDDTDLWRLGQVCLPNQQSKCSIWKFFQMDPNM